MIVHFDFSNSKGHLLTNSDITRLEKPNLDDHIGTGTINKCANHRDIMFQINRMGIWFIFLLLSLFLFFIIWGDQGFIELNELQSEYQQLHHHSQSLEQENVDLHQLIERLKHDPKYVERIARTELGMIRDNEKIIKFSRREQ